MKPYNVINEMINKKKIFEEQIPVLLFIQPYRVGATYDFVDETPKCNHSNESY